MLTFTAEEYEIIARLSAPGGWDQGEAEGIKKKIKDHLILKEIAFCCYCQIPMDEWHRMTIDIEHVLPKSVFPEFTFEIKNLNVSCKRCNMQIKGDDHSFYIGERGQATEFASAHYKFVHPNLDSYEQHLVRKSEQLGKKVMVKYAVKTAKGRETYRYFELMKIEKAMVDRAQGLRGTRAVKTLSRRRAAEAEDLLRAETH